MATPLDSGATGNGGHAQGGGIANWATLTVNSSTLRGNQAIGGAGVVGGNGLGGGIWIDGQATITLLGSTITGNSAIGGDGDEEDGGGVYNSLGEIAWVDLLTLIDDNFATTCDDDVLGILCLIL